MVDQKENLKLVQIMIVDIIDVGSGNIKSIQNWIERLYVQTRVVKKSTEIKSDFLILPGVGSAGLYMDRLKKSSFDKAIYEHVGKGHRLLGICLGFQIMGEYSQEDGGVEGLRLLDGYTARLDKNISHNGWEKFIINKDKLGIQSFNSKMGLTKKKNINGRVFYNHEYGFINRDDKAYNQEILKDLNKYSSLAIKDNIIGMQFHPEKSQQTGLDLMSIIL